MYVFVVTLFFYYFFDVCTMYMREIYVQVCYDSSRLFYKRGHAVHIVFRMFQVRIMFRMFQVMIFFSHVSSKDFSESGCNPRL